MDKEIIALILVVLALGLWLSERFPVIVPTFILVAGSFLLSVSPPPIDPVLGLFFCGMCLGLTLRYYQIDKALAGLTTRISGGSLRLNFRLAMLITAVVAMWTTNSTAMAVCLPAFDSTIQQLNREQPLQAKGYVIGLAMAANFGGMATPIGTAPNAIAMSALEPMLPLSFGRWMLLMLPLALLFLCVTDVLVARIFKISSKPWQAEQLENSADIRLHRGALWLFGGTVLFWVTQNFHGLHPLTVGFTAATIAFATGLLPAKALKDIDWDVLILIGGGLLLGKLLEDYGWMKRTADVFQGFNLSMNQKLGLLMALATFGSAVSSNTATAILLMPVAVKIVPEVHAIIGIAAACSLGVPFSISTPANSLVAGRYNVRNWDLMKVGLPIAIGGCLLVYATVEMVVKFFK